MCIEVDGQKLDDTARLAILREIEEESKFVPSQFEPRNRYKRWVNFYPYASSRHTTKEDADTCRCDGCIACIEVEFTEGQGL